MPQQRQAGHPQPGQRDAVLKTARNSRTGARTNLTKFSKQSSSSTSSVDSKCLQHTIHAGKNDTCALEAGGACTWHAVQRREIRAAGFSPRQACAGYLPTVTASSRSVQSTGMCKSNTFSYFRSASRWQQGQRTHT